MPTFRSYPRVTSILPTDALVLDRIGSGTEFIEGSDFLPASAGQGIIAANNLILASGYFYGLRSGSGTFTGTTLPQLSGIVAPAFIEIADLDNNVGTNNLVINAFAGDLISDHGTTAATYTMTINNTIIRLIANTTSWTVIPYGG